MIERGLNISKSESLYYILAVLLLAYPLFEDVLPKIFTRSLFFLGFAIAACLFVKKKSFDLRSYGVGILWLVLGVIALLGYLATFQVTEFPVLALFISILLALFGAAATEWVKPFLRVLLWMLVIHLLATFFFYVFPDVYTDFVKPRFFADQPDAIGYQSGLTMHYSNNGDLMAFGLILSSSFFFFSKKGKGALYLILMLLFLFALFLTQKRAQLGFGILGVICLYLMTERKNKILKLALLSVLALVAIMILAQYSEGIANSIKRIIETTTADNMNEVTSGRVLLWAHALEQWGQSPVVGTGWSTFVFLWPNGSLVSIYAHNDILQLLAETGVLGAAIFLAASVGTLVVSVKAVIMLKSDVSSDCDPSLKVFRKQSAAFAAAFQIFALLYACTFGTLLQMTLVFMPFFLAVSISYSYRCNIYPSILVIDQKEIA